MMSIQVCVLLLFGVGTAHACPYLLQTERAQARLVDSSDVEASSSSRRRSTQRNNHVHHFSRKLQTDADRFVGAPEEAIEDAKDWIANIIGNDDEMGPKFVRLGFHDCVGGCDGCIFLDNPDNFGLQLPIDELVPVVEFYSSQLTRADVWVLAAVHAADLAREDDDNDGGTGYFPFDFYGRPKCDDPTQQGEDVPPPSAYVTTSELLEFF
jgi:hypothetical protein